MAARNVRLMGEDILRRTARPVSPQEILSDKIQKLIDDMMSTSVQIPENGFITAGLAAPQVDESLRIFIILNEGSDRKKRPYRAFINPELEFTSQHMKEDMESCLSTPGICGKVRRYTQVKVTYFDRLGKKQREKFEGDAAVFIQHENDHLDGILWVDRVTDTKTFAYC